MTPDEITQDMKDHFSIGFQEKCKAWGRQDCIDFLRDCQKTHIGWAEYFEQNPEIEKEYMKTGEWDGAKTHRQLEAQYDQAINFIQNHTKDNQLLNQTEKDSSG